MPAPKLQLPRLPDWGVVLAIVTLAIGLIWTAGVNAQRFETVEKKAEKFDAAMDALIRLDANLASIDKRLERIENKP